MSTRAHNRPTDIDTQFRELAHRSDNGVDVTLSWHAETDELLVCVYDERRDAYFEIHLSATSRSTSTTTPTPTSTTATMGLPRRRDQGRDQCVHRRDLQRKRRV